MVTDTNDERMDTMKNNSNTQSSAAALYDGGWRAKDRDELKAAYGLTDDEADDICECLESFEQET